MLRKDGVRDRVPQWYYALEQDEINTRALIDLQGVVHISHETVSGRQAVKLEAFSPAQIGNTLAPFPESGGGLMIYSYSQINQYLSCPRGYRHRYLEGWREKKTRANLVFGRAFEHALEPFTEVGLKVAVAAPNSPVALRFAAPE